MALITVQRSPSSNDSPPSSEYGSSLNSQEEEFLQNRSLSEYYFAVKGYAVLLPKKECQQGRQRKSAMPPADIQAHLQAILHLLRSGDTLQMAVRLESFHSGRIRYLAVVTTQCRQEAEESCLLGVDFTTSTPTIGLVLAVLADTVINLDGDGGFSVSSAGRKHIFKPISVQAMWSALQSVHKESGRARDNHWFQGGLNHDWVGTYHNGISSDQSCVNEWNAMEGLESKRPPSPDSLTNKEETEVLIRSKLKEIMTSVDIDEVTSKYIRTRLEEDLKADLFQFKSFIDLEMLTILGQMDAATEIFPHVYLGSEWNASNLEELRKNGVGFILNVTKEIDNFFPGMFDYLNIRVYDDEKTELLRHWDDTYKYISQVKEKGSKVLVHCKMGISRSASVVIAYAMKSTNLSLADATELVKSKRSCIKPNQAFISQLKIYQGILDASRQRHNALFRSKSETNLKTTQLSPPSTRLSYVPRGAAQNLAIPDFKLKPTPPSVEEKEKDSSNSLSPPLPTLNVPLPSVTGRRPRSWSPDEEATKMLNLEPFEEQDFGECLQKSRSLNDQAWQAHVTVIQRDLRDPGGGLVEALNPLYVPQRTTGSSLGTLCQRLEDVPMSSSVKDRINEFESAKITIGGSPPSFHGNRKTALFIENVTNSSSTDCDLTPEEGVDGSILLKFDSESSSGKERKDGDGEISTSEIPITLKKDPISWPTGIVKKQKEDLEGKVRGGKEKPPIALGEGNVEGVGSVNSHSGEPTKKEDPFSLKLDNVFDREERKDSGKSSIVSGVKEDSPSRNNSWGSFDSAVVLPDRNAPSRQSSWGSCDTRLSGSSVPLSRNSSFGAFDGKTPFFGGVGHESCLPNPPPPTYIALCFDKEILPPRKPKIRPLNALHLPEDPMGVGNVKAYPPIPFKMGSEAEEGSDAVPPTTLLLKACYTEGEVTSLPLTRSQTDGGCFPYVSGSMKCVLKTSPQTPEHEIPLPGTVKQQRQKLESKARPQEDFAKLSVPTIGRSLSSGCVSSFGSTAEGSFQPEQGWHITRSCSEKRCKTALEGAKGNVKKITRALETQRVLPTSLKASRSLKQRTTNTVKPDVMPRSQSLERLGTPVCSHFTSSSSSPPTPNKRWSTSALRQEATACSQTFLEHLVGEAQAQVSLLEKEQEEINVKNLVGLFEDGRSTPLGHHAQFHGPHESPTLGVDNWLKRKAPRPRSESIGERGGDNLPPVPQRKSSLDYTYKPAPKSPPGIISARRNASLSQVSGKSPPSSPIILTNGVTGGCFKTSPNPPKLPPPSQGGSRACGSEARRRKQQGKTHPVSKLTSRENTL